MNPVIIAPDSERRVANAMRASNPPTAPDAPRMDRRPSMNRRPFFGGNAVPSNARVPTVSRTNRLYHKIVAALSPRAPGAPAKNRQGRASFVVARSRRAPGAPAKSRQARTTMSDDRKTELQTLLTEKIVSRDVAEIQEALTKLSELFFLDEQSGLQRLMMKLDGLTLVLSAMKMHPSNRTIQSEGSSVLMNLMSDTSVEATRSILSCMRLSRNDLFLQRVAVGALAKFVDRRSSASLVVELGGVHDVVTVMKEFPDDRPLQEDGCVFLTSIGSYKEHHTLLRQAGATTVVGTAVGQHESSTKIQKTANTFFNLLCQME